MGLFSKHKDDQSKLPEPPAPPATDKGAPASEMPVPPASTPEPVAPGTGDVSAPSKLSAPPMPGGSLDDIKSQLAPSSPAPGGMGPEAPELVPEGNAPVMQAPEEQDFTAESSSGDDSLFDFSDLNLGSPNSEQTGGESLGQLTTLEESPTDTPEGTIDTHMNDDVSLNFIQGGHKSRKLNENYYVTTHQFKALLEIVEGVKERVKMSNERHLRLLDIKAEEDIEYENLRRDFQYIEDKLYEADKLIFEK